MTHQILKWRVNVEKPETITCGMVIGFGFQNDLLVFWADSHDSLERTFQVFGTGWDIPDEFYPLLSVQVGPLAWHLCEKFLEVSR